VEISIPRVENSILRVENSILRVKNSKKRVKNRTIRVEFKVNEKQNSIRKPFYSKRFDVTNKEKTTSVNKYTTELCVFIVKNYQLKIKMRPAIMINAPNDVSP
jgi:hypothetical protein